MIFIYLTIFLSSSIIAFINLSPQFGANPSKKQREQYSKFDNYENGEFKNIEKMISLESDISFFDFFKKDTNRFPEKNISTEKINYGQFKNNHDSISFAWLGHSSFIFNINGKIILLDPMLSNYASPIPIKTLKRFNSEIAISLDEIDSVDVIIISHDHYDHLDYKTIKKLNNKVEKYIVPIGIGNHLRGWGVNEKNITELNWYNKTSYSNIEFVCLPSRHYSGRGPKNKNSTLWGSWAIISDLGKIYFSGDGGYGKHFEEIGNKYGPFDLTLIDSGQYNEAWQHSHMFPRESVQAAIDLKADFYMPIHWGAFVLSMHHWTEPVEQAKFHADQKKQKIITPPIGQIIKFSQLNSINTGDWWK